MFPWAYYLFASAVSFSKTPMTLAASLVSSKSENFSPHLGCSRHSLKKATMPVVASVTSLLVAGAAALAAKPAFARSIKTCVRVLPSSCENRVILARNSSGNLKYDPFLGMVYTSVYIVIYSEYIRVYMPFPSENPRGKGGKKRKKRAGYFIDLPSSSSA